jgi:hypothetical protein
VSGVGNRFALIAAIVPGGIVTTHTVYCLKNVLDRDRMLFLTALLNSHVLNLVVRLLMGSHVTTSLVEGLPAPLWCGDRGDRRVAELADRLGTNPNDLRSTFEVQALLGWRFGLSADLFEQVLDGTPSVSPDARRQTLEIHRALPIVR